jgi:hypothetical protein
VTPSLVVRVMTERRVVLLPLAALAVLNVALYAFAVYPLSLRVSGLETRAGEAERARMLAEQEFAAARAMVSSREQADVELQTFYRDVLPSNLAGARRITYARLAQLASDTDLLYARRSYEEDTRHRGALRKLRIRMELAGEYGSVREFLHRLETSREFVVIERIGLMEGSGDDPPLRLSLELATYFQGDDDR